MKKLRILFLIILIIVTSNYSYANEKIKSVLILNSYHKGFPWTDNIVKGIESVFDKESENIEIKVEYMDTKAIKYEEKYKTQLFEFLKFKYNSHIFDLIISSDDNAFNFLREFHEKLFPRSPIIVCGVNNRNAPGLVDPEKFTGILESTSHEETIELILDLHPQTKKIYMVIDKTPSGKYRWRVTEPSFSRYKGIEFIRLSDDYTITEIEDLLKGLKNDSAVIFFTLYRDKSGRYLSLKESASRVTAVSARPVYTTHLLELPYGVVGGKVLGGFHHGKTIADIGMRVLNGHDIKNIPFLQKSPTQYVFDYGQLEKWDIKQSVLPEGSIILNKPFSVYDTYKLYIWSAIIAIIVLFLIILSLQTNIQRRKNAEDRLKKQNYYLERSQDLGKIGTWELDLINNTLVWTDENCRIFGVPEGSVVNYEVFLSKVHPDDRDYVNREWKAGVEGKTYDIEHRLLLNGEVKWVREKADITFDDSGNAINAIGFTQDITVRKQAEENLEHERELFKSIIDKIPVMLTRYDPHANMLFLNSEFEQKIGWTTQEVQNIDMMEKVYPNPEYRQEAYEYMQQAKSEWKEFRVQSKSGKIIESEWSNIRLEDGTQIGIGRDITEKKQLEERLHQAQKMESIGQLAGGIAHDFNNVLYPIIGFTQLSQDELPKDHPVQENLTDILNGAKRARDLVKRILLFSRQKESKLKVTTLQPVIQESYNLLRSTIPSNINMLLDLYEGDDCVLCDTSEIHEIILNLCTNAYHAIVKDKGEIIISLKKENTVPDLNLDPGEYLCLSVKDNGVGIPETIMDRIFEPYITTKDVGKGSGLGLSVVHGIVKSYHGDIRVESDSLQGTEFKIFLPCTAQVALNETIEERKDDITGNNEHILFVDDEDSIIKLGVRALERSGYRVTGINNSPEAFKLFDSKPDDFDIVITDMAMPNIVGSDLAKKIHELRPDIPIIICSGYSEKLDKIDSKNLNVAAFLDKPLEIKNLVKKVLEILDKKMAK